VSSTVAAFDFPFSRLRSSKLSLGLRADTEDDDPATAEESFVLDSERGVEAVAVLVLAVNVGPENSCEDPQLGSAVGYGVLACAVSVIEVVVVGIVVFWIVGAEGVGWSTWSAETDGGVWMAFVLDELSEEA
jgi:hypothetical protein